MGLLDFPKKVYDFITKPEVQDEGGVVGNMTAGVKSLVGVALKPFEKAWCGVKTVKDDVVQAGTNIKNGATLNPLELGKNLGKGTILTVNEGGNLISSGIGGTVEVAEDVDLAVCDTVDYINSAVHRVTRLAKFIPIVGTTLSHAGAIALSPVTVSTKIGRLPAKVTRKVRAKIGDPITNFHKGISEKFAISPSAPSAASDAGAGAEPEAG